MSRDYALASGEHGETVAHRADCPDVRALADRGEPVITLFQCEGLLPADIKRHSCLDEYDGWCDGWE